MKLSAFDNALLLTFYYKYGWARNKLGIKPFYRMEDSQRKTLNTTSG